MVVSATVRSSMGLWRSEVKAKNKISPIMDEIGARIGRAVSGGAAEVLPIALFGLSWGLRDLFLAAASPAAESLTLSFAGGGAVGLVIGAVSYGLRRWPGGYLTATAMQFLIVYLVLGFLS